MNAKYKERQMAEILIGYFEKFPCLYAIQSSDHLAKHERAEAYEKIWIEMRKYDPTIELQQIETRIRSLRTQYGRELRHQRKKKLSTVSDELYQPKLWCFQQLSFLKPHIRKSRSTASDELYEIQKKRLKVFNEKPEYSNNVKGERRSRKLERNWSKEETERLVEEIRMREILWNPEVRGYRDIDLRTKNWDEVSDAVRIPKQHIVNKWNNLRKSFRTMYKKRHSKLTDPDEKIPLSDSYCMLAFLGNTLFLRDAYDENSVKIDEESLSNSPTQKYETVEFECIGEESACSMENDESILNEDTKSGNSEEAYFETFYPDEDKQSDPCNENSVDVVQADESKVDIWHSIAQFVACNGREWQQKHPSIANQFKTVIYKALLDFQIKTSDLEESAAYKNS